MNRNLVNSTSCWLSSKHLIPHLHLFFLTKNGIQTHQQVAQYGVFSILSFLMAEPCTIVYSHMLKKCRFSRLCDPKNKNFEWFLICYLISIFFFIFCSSIIYLRLMIISVSSTILNKSIKQANIVHSQPLFNCSVLFKSHYFSRNIICLRIIFIITWRHYGTTILSLTLGHWSLVFYALH